MRLVLISRLPIYGLNSRSASIKVAACNTDITVSVYSIERRRFFVGPLEGNSMALEKIEKIQRKKNLHEIDFVFSIFQKKFPSLYLYSFLLFLGPSHFMWNSR